MKTETAARESEIFGQERLNARCHFSQEEVEGLNLSPHCKNVASLCGVSIFSLRVSDLSLGTSVGEKWFTVLKT